MDLALPPEWHQQQEAEERQLLDDHARVWAVLRGLQRLPDTAPVLATAGAR